MAREIVRNGVSFDALTYLERAELLFRATNNEKRECKRILLLKAHAYWALGAGEEILAIAEETMRLREGNPVNRGLRLQEITRLICWTTDVRRSIGVQRFCFGYMSSSRWRDQPSEAYAVRAEALQKLGRILAAVDTLITRALELIDRTIPDIDKKNIYFRALNLNAWINRALARCIQFAQDERVLVLEAKAEGNGRDYAL